MIAIMKEKGRSCARTRKENGYGEKDCKLEKFRIRKRHRESERDRYKKDNKQRKRNGAGHQKTV